MQNFTIYKITTSEGVQEFMPLFIYYMQFYGMEMDEVKYEAYFNSILDKESAHILIAKDGKEAMGMTVLYESLSSFACGKILFINDLWVEEKHRKKNVGTFLMEEIKAVAISRDCKRMDLQTELTNHKAQGLYRKMGFREEKEFTNFSLYL